MENVLRKNWPAIAVLIIILILWAFNKAGSETESKWQAAYYPEGCLGCTDKWIASPFFVTVNECIAWVHNKQKERLASAQKDPNTEAFRTAAKEEGYPETQINAYLQSKGYPTPQTDAAECSFDCKKDRDWNVLVCKETVDVLGKPSM